MMNCKQSKPLVRVHNNRKQQKRSTPIFSPVSLTYLGDREHEFDDFENGEIILETEDVYHRILGSVSVLSCSEVDCLYTIDQRYWRNNSHFLRTMTLVHYLLAIQQGSYIEQRWENIVLTYQLVLKYWQERETGYRDFRKIIANSPNYKGFPSHRKCAIQNCVKFAEYGKVHRRPCICKFHFQERLHEYVYRRKQACPYFNTYTACYRELQWKLFGQALECKMRYFAS